MTYNFKQLKIDIRNVDIGRKIQFFDATTLPKKDEVSMNKMAWLDAAVLYCDISGYTSLTNQTRKKTVARILSAFHYSMVKVTNDCQGEVFSIAGDRVMSVFSLENRNSTINMAIKCGLVMQSVVRYILPKEFEERNFSQTLACTIGLDYGPVLMGKFGTKKTKDIILVGDAANIAAKMQSEADPDKTMVSKVVYDNFPDWITHDYWTPQKIDLKNLGERQVWHSGTYYVIKEE